MRLYKVRMKNIEETILVERRTERGYKGALGSIQSSTLRGAFTTSLYLNGYIKKESLKEFRDNLYIVVSNAYPVKDGLESYPAHPFMYECKIDGEKVNYIDEVVKQLKSGKEAEYKIECSEGHIALNYVHPRPIIPKNEPKTMFETVSLHTELKVSTGISKHRATAQKGMIYEYEVIMGNQDFWAFLGVSDKLSEHINKDLEIRIGRGISRGYGLSKITEVKEIYFDEISDKIKEQIDEEMIFYAFTPLLGSVSSTQYFPYPEEIDLNEMMKIYGFNSGEYGKITIKRVYAKTREFSCGWDMIKNIKRPSFKEIASEGSIIVAKIEEKADTSKALALLSIIGFPVKFEDYIVSGINVILPIKMCPIGGS